MSELAWFVLLEEVVKFKPFNINKSVSTRVE